MAVRQINDRSKLIHSAEEHSLLALPMYGGLPHDDQMRVRVVDAPRHITSKFIRLRCLNEFTEMFARSSLPPTLPRLR